RLSLFAISAVACLFAACSASTGTGSATIALTDAVNDDLDTFEVDVHDISFTKLDGNTVSVMSRTTRVDFAALESLSELFVGVAMPAGSSAGRRQTLEF